MKEFLGSKCRFDNYELALETNDIHKAAEWDKAGFCVHFVYDGHYIGYFTFGGSVRNEDFLPDKDASYGVYFYLKETNDYVVSMPDEICDTLEEEQPKNNAIIHTVNGFEMTS